MTPINISNFSLAGSFTLDPFKRLSTLLTPCALQAARLTIARNPQDDFAGVGLDRNATRAKLGGL
jgi:hypothetical protein